MESKVLPKPNKLEEHLFGWEDAWATRLFTFLIGPIFLADCFARSIRRSGQSSFPIPVGSAASVGPASKPHDEVKKVPKQVIPVVVLLLFFAVRRRQRTRWPFKRHGKMRAKPTVSGERAPPPSSGRASHCRKWPHKSASALRQATNVNNPHCLSQPRTQ